MLFRSVFEAVGDLTATAMVSGQPIEGDEYTRRLRGGVLADGLVSVIATALGSLPLTTFAQNNGVIQMTGVASRHVGKYIAVILVLLGLFPVLRNVVRVTPILSAKSRSEGRLVPAGNTSSQILLTIYSSASAAGL